MSNNKDWTGNKKTTFVTLGASNHTDHDRAEYDYYATEPKAADLLCDKEGNVIYNEDGTPKKMSSAKCYAWFVWEKGFKGDPVIKWIN